MYICIVQNVSPIMKSSSVFVGFDDDKDFHVPISKENYDDICLHAAVDGQKVFEVDIPMRDGIRLSLVSLDWLVETFPDHPYKNIFTQAKINSIKRQIDQFHGEILDYEDPGTKIPVVDLLKNEVLQ